MNSKDPVETLRSGTRRGHVVGKKANMLFTARSASWSFRGKLNKLDSKEAMDAAYGKYVGNVAPKSTTLRGKAADLLWASETSKDLNRKKEAVIEHDVAALDSWFLTAKDAHKPIYAGPSGHTLAYLNLYAHAVDELVVQRSNWIKQDKKIDLLESKANTESLAPEDKALINKARQLFQAREVQYNLDKRMSRLEDKAEDKTITKEEQAELKNIIKTLKQNMQDVAVKKTQGVALEDMPADKLSLDQADTLLQKNLDKLIKKLNIGANTLKGIDQQAVAEANDKIKQGGYPSLEEARLVMMASLMGDKEHHSWDEVMIASHGVKTKVFDKESPENNLKYNFRGSYGDMFTSNISSVQKTAQQAMQSVENKFSSRPDFSEAMTQWKDKVSSTDQPGDEAVVTHENLSKRDLAAFKATQQRGVSKSDLGWATPVYAGALGTMLYDAFTVAVSQVPVAMMGKQLAICASEFANSTVTGASSPGASDVMMKEVQERLGTPFVAGAIILAGAAISDAIEYKKSGKLNSVSAAQNMAKFTPQISIKALSTAVGSALTIGLGKWLPGQLVRCNPAAAATISVREAAQLLVNNPMNAAAYRLSEKVPKMLSQIPGVNLESEVLSYAKGHESKAILLHLLRSTGVLAVTTGLQATGSLSTNQFSIDNLLLNFVMHASTEFLVDAMLEKRGWATKESGKDADSIMKNMSSAALGHPTGKVADALVPKPKGYAPETRLPKLEHADEKAVFALTGGNSSATLAAKIAVSIGTYIGWSAFNAADDKGGAIGMNVLSQTVISVILAAKRLQDAGSGSHSPHELPPVVRWYQDAKQLVNDKLGLDVSSDIASLHEDMEMGKMEILDPATLAAEEAAANSAASSEQYALDMQQALGSAFHQGEASSSGTSHQKATLTEITEEPELKQNR